MVLDAFLKFPEGAPKATALRSVFALLSLNNEMIARAKLEPGLVGDGIPNGLFPVPSNDRLAKLAARVRFSSSDLARLGISLAQLEPFLLGSNDAFKGQTLEPERYTA